MIGQGLIKASVCLFIFKTKVGSISKDTRDRVGEMSMMRVGTLMVGWHGEESKEEIAELFTFLSQAYILTHMCST